MGHLLAYGLDLVGPHCQSLGVHSSPDSSHLLSMLTTTYGGATASAHGRERTGAGEEPSFFRTYRTSPVAAALSPKSCTARVRFQLV